MGAGDRGGAGSGCGPSGCLLIVLALGVLIGFLYLEHGSGGDGRGTGHDPVAVILPKTVEGKRQVGSSGPLAGYPETSSELSSAGLGDASQAAYGDAAGTPAVWVVTAARNHGQVAGWLAANAPSSASATSSRPQLRIAGTTTCYQDRHDDRSLCTWYDENYLVQVSGPADAEAVQQVLLRVYDGTER